MYEKKLTESQQDYLKIINGLIETNRVARVKEIAQAKGVSMPSVTESMKKLAADDWIHYKSRGFIELTSKGDKAASYFSRRSEFLRHFLEDVLGTEEVQAKAEACTLEHHLSDQSLKRFGLLYQFLNHCPKMDTNLLDTFQQCVQNSSEDSDYFCMTGNYPHLDKNHQHVLLKNLKENQRARIMLLSSHEESRKFFLDKSLLPGIEITMDRVLANSVLIKHKNEEIEIPTKFTSSMEVSIINQEKES